MLKAKKTLTLLSMTYLHYYVHMLVDTIFLENLMLLIRQSQTEKNIFWEIPCNLHQQLQRPLQGLLKPLNKLDKRAEEHSSLTSCVATPRHFEALSLH